MKAKIKLYSYEDGVTETRDVSGTDLDDIRESAADALGDWMRDGEWGDDGATVSGKWSIISLEEIDEDTDLSGNLYDDVDVEIEPDTSGKIKAAAGPDSCGDDDDDHDWTREGEGGCRENPGVWSLGGTKMKFRSHCRCCGLHKTEITVGSQRNAEDHDTVEYCQLADEEIVGHRERGTMDEA